MSNRGVCFWVFALGLAGMQVEATASCDISGSNVMFQGMEKRDGVSSGKQTQDSATQGRTQSKAAPPAPPLK